MGPSAWLPVVQDRVDAFARAVEGWHWAHNDVDRASRGTHPSRRVVAHGEALRGDGGGATQSPSTTQGSFEEREGTNDRGEGQEASSSSRVSRPSKIC